MNVLDQYDEARTALVHAINYYDDHGLVEVDVMRRFLAAETALGHLGTLLGWVPSALR